MLVNCPRRGSLISQTRPWKTEGVRAPHWEYTLGSHPSCLFPWGSCGLEGCEELPELRIPFDSLDFHGVDVLWMGSTLTCASSEQKKVRLLVFTFTRGQVQALHTIRETISHVFKASHVQRTFFKWFSFNYKLVGGPSNAQLPCSPFLP